MHTKKDPKLHLLKVLLWTLFAVWVCFLGYCANGHNKYEPNSEVNSQKLPDLSATVESADKDNIDGPKSFVMREHGNIRGAITTHIIKSSEKEG
mmetsp:Transcript_3816/g.6475  ORF Transcript_3816/g.6475 Transcript_3816/m.6475 type:complete len:94 (-) Transcript_3816:224-505(-)